jgi:ectoine hydroxylase-related dioxygenase (phytanoyl-CoA dioxygenase family)
MDEASFFREHGWVVLRRAFPPERAAELAREVDRVAPETALPAERVHELIGVSARSPMLAEQVRDASVAARVASLLGCPRVQLLQDTLLVKPPGSAARVEWHQDHTYMGFLDPPAAVSVRLALTECTLESGCLRVIDGSHRWGPLGETRALRSDEVTDDSALLPEGWEEHVVPIELDPGDASVHHCLTFHGSLENKSGQSRKTLIARLIDPRTRLVAEKLPSPAYRVWFPTDEEGRLCGPTFPLL